MKTLKNQACATLAAFGLSLLLLPAGCGQKEGSPPPRAEATTPKPDTSAPKAPTSPNQPPAVHPPADPLANAKRQSRENLKEIALALHSCHDATKVLPVGLMDHRTMTTGLSWRVQLLPYLSDEAARDLYKKFKLDEAWDSEHNKKLLESMPKVYAPVRGEAAPGTTFYQGFAAHFTGPKGMELPPNAPLFQGNPPVPFPDPRHKHPQSPRAPAGTPIPMIGRSIIQFVDGTSNTFLVAEAGTAVPWTKPQDIPFQVELMNAPPNSGTWPKLGGLFDGDFHVIMADGETVHYIKKDPPADKLRPFITVADGLIPDYAGIGVTEPEWIKNMKKNPPVPGSGATDKREEGKK